MPSSPDKGREAVLRAELERLQQWFKDRDRPGHTSQAIHIGMALDEANRSVTSAVCAPMTASDFRLMSESEKYGCYASAYRNMASWRLLAKQNEETAAEALRQRDARPASARQDKE